MNLIICSTCGQVFHNRDEVATHRANTQHWNFDNVPEDRVNEYFQQRQTAASQQGPPSFAATASVGFQPAGFPQASYQTYPSQPPRHQSTAAASGPASGGFTPYTSSSSPWPSTAPYSVSPTPPTGIPHQPSPFGQMSHGRSTSNPLHSIPEGLEGPPSPTRQGRAGSSATGNPRGIGSSQRSQFQPLSNLEVGELTQSLSRLPPPRSGRSGVPRFRTSPQKESQVEKASASRRQRTAPESREGLEELPLPTLQKEVYKVLKYRLGDDNVITKDLSQDVMAYALPSNISPLSADPTAWGSLLTNPLVVSDDMLQQMLPVSSETHQKPYPGFVTYYVRSFRVKKEALVKWISEWEAEGITHPEFEAWMAKMVLLRSDSFVYIRYVGMSKAVSAYTRFQQDLQRGGFYGMWMKKWIQEHSEPMKNVQLFVFSAAEAQPYENTAGGTISAPVAGRHIDWREQILIQLFGRSVLLNREAGGRNVRYNRPKADEELFKRLKTSGLAAMESSSGFQAPSNNAHQAIANWLAAARQTVDAGPKFYGTDVVPMEDVRWKVLGKMATSASFSGECLFAIFGAAPSIKSVKSTVPVWHEGARSIDLMRDMLAGLLALEKKKASYSIGDLNTLTDNFRMPWFDVWNTPKQPSGSLAHGIEHSRTYMSIANPLFVMSLGIGPAWIARNNFQAVPLHANHEYLFTQGFSAMEVAGTLTLQHWTTPKASLFDDRNHSFLHLSCLHPGVINYQTELPLYRLIDLTLFKAVLVIDVIFNELRSCRPGFDRLSLLKRVQQTVEKRENSAGFQRAFDQVLQEYKHPRWAQPRSISSAVKAKGGVFKESLDGTSINTTSKNAGYVEDRLTQFHYAALFWRRPDGRDVTILLRVSGNIATSKQLTVHFTLRGIDIRTEGMSLPLKQPRSNNPAFHMASVTYPGELIRELLDAGLPGMLDAVALWEYEIFAKKGDVDFKSLFANNSFYLHDGSIMRMFTEENLRRCKPCEVKNYAVCTWVQQGSYCDQCAADGDICVMDSTPHTPRFEFDGQQRPDTSSASPAPQPKANSVPTGGARKRQGTLSIDERGALGLKRPGATHSGSPFSKQQVQQHARSFSSSGLAQQQRGRMHVDLSGHASFIPSGQTRPEPAPPPGPISRSYDPFSMPGPVASFAPRPTFTQQQQDPLFQRPGQSRTCKACALYREAVCNGGLPCNECIAKGIAHLCKYD